MNTGNFPKVYAPNKLRIVIIFIVLRSLLDVLQNRKGEKKSLTWKADINSRITITCALRFKHGFKPTNGGCIRVAGTQDCTQAQV